MGADPALAAYEAFAAIYNDFNHLNDYEMWVGETLLPELEKHGLRQGRVLDVACGTGRAFAPLLQRGWKIHGTDLSPAMLEIAEREGGGKVELQPADMRELPVLGEFELVISLNDSVNYLLGDDDLTRALAAMRSNLADDGLLLFDCNTKSTYETAYSTVIREVEHNGRRWTWRGLGEVEGAPVTFESAIEGDDVEPIVHRERFRPEPEAREAMEAAGLEVLAALGMREEEGRVILTEPADEQRDYKLVFIGRKAG